MFLDVPEINRDALALVARYGMSEVFGCAQDGARIGSAPDAETPASHSNWDSVSTS